MRNPDANDEPRGDTEAEPHEPPRPRLPRRAPPTYGAPVPPIDPHAPQVPTPRDILLGSTRVPHPYAERSGLPLGQIRGTLRTKEALEDLRERAEVVAGTRLTHPEILELIVAYALLHERPFLTWVADTQGPRAA